MPLVKHKPFDGLDARSRGNLSTSAWSLCVGAGVSFGLVPTWQELTRRVVNEAFSTAYDDAGFEDLVKATRWSLDALLQGAANKLALVGKPKETFGELLESALYSDLLTQADAAGLKKCLSDALNNPRWLRKEEILELTDFFENSHGGSTLVNLSRSLAEAKETRKGPQAIINFNADTLLFALLDLFLIRAHAAKIGKWEHPSFAFVRTLRGIDGLPAGATPIFHCHGAISPSPSGRLKKAKRRDSREHLVFTEADYLSIAGNVATWAQSLFLFHAQSSRLLIVGHSLSDPNIRKWLAWSLSSSVEEMAAVSTASEFTARHIWVAKRPKEADQRQIQEISLLHLGVRVCWLDDWEQIGGVFDNLLAL
ncbi:SIR2 family protein [Paracidovorax valerianellae]|uniref:SIR2-like domain-containing protein n=1 Tax=Paracidovorax valerianellae TaxID=187868 RepID=A0A1G7C8H4_9BURK|nr:SIR2 family protein [Paracidovorax valerianellae]MDA8446558.1 SIR2 family protein [Paracidovorax valerianellae]SDE34735.1 SIR2-like domain-containing protein [Paracidovorax valerianellae]